MEQKMVRVPFDLETAKKITNGEIKGKIVTRDGRAARVICWDKRSGNNMPIVALVTMKSIERFYTYKENGYCCSDETKSDFDLFVEMPEYFTDGEVVVQSWERDGHYCKWVSIIKDIELLNSGNIVTTDYFSVCIDADKNNKFAPCFGSMSNAANDIRKADDSEKEIVIKALNESKDERAKNYLKRFFGIGQKDEPKFNPFDRVLCRNSTGVWFADFFSHIGEDGRFCCIGGFYKHCIPYEGNEHLLGTDKDYNE